MPSQQLVHSSSWFQVCIPYHSNLISTTVNFKFKRKYISVVIDHVQIVVPDPRSGAKIHCLHKPSAQHFYAPPGWTHCSDLVVNFHHEAILNSMGHSTMETNFSHCNCNKKLGIKSMNYEAILRQKWTISSVLKRRGYKHLIGVRIL